MYNTAGNGTYIVHVRHYANFVPFGSYGINLINEDNGRSMLFSHSKQLSH